MGQRFGVLILFGVLAGAGLLFWIIRGFGASDPSEPELPSASEFLEGRVRVEVLNTGGVAGVAGAATESLRDHGFDVVYFGNAETYSEEPSVVLDRVGDLETARAVAEVLGVPTFRSEMDSTLLVDVTVRLGPEWPDSGTVAEATGTHQAWWDPRRLLHGGGALRPTTWTGP